MRWLTAGTGDERALSLEGSCHCRAFVGAALLRFGARGQTRRARGRQLRLSERAISPQTTMRSSVPGITSAIACVSIFFACVAPADAVQLVTEQEAGYPDDPYGIERGGPTPGPEVEVVSPALSGLVKSPFYLKIKFKAHGGAEIDRDSITITYKKVPAVDITQRIRSAIRADGIDLTDAELPAGIHPFRST
jgi:hypothetical protein